MAPRPGNRQRATLTKQALISQTPCEITGVGYPPSGRTLISLSVPVHGSAEGATAKGLNDSGINFSVPLVVESPTVLSCDIGGTALCIWVDTAPLLRTASNGSILPRPLTFFT